MTKLTDKKRAEIKRLVESAKASGLLKTKGPELPTGDRLTVTQAARIAGVSIWTIYRLAEQGFLKTVRPSPNKVLIFKASLDAHLAACQDPEFWEVHRLGKARSQ